LSGATGILDGTHCPVTFNAHFKSHLNVSKNEEAGPWQKKSWWSKKLKCSALNTQVPFLSYSKHCFTYLVWQVGNRIIFW